MRCSIGRGNDPIRRSHEERVSEVIGRPRLPHHGNRKTANIEGMGCTRRQSYDTAQPLLNQRERAAIE